MGASRAYRGVSAGERRAERRRQLIDSALDCLHGGGLAGVTVRSVCAGAQLTARYFYESFADVDAVLLAAVSTVTDEVAAASLAAMAAAPAEPAARVRAAIGAGFGVVADDPRRASALLAASAGHGPLRERRLAVVTELADVVIAMLPLLSSLGLRERRRARATALFLMGGSVDVIEAVLAGRLRMSRSAVVDQLTALWLGALGVPDGAGGTGPRARA